MKIGIDCRLLGPEQGGLGRYIEQLVLHLSLIDQENDYVLFLRSENINKVKIGNEHFKYTKVLADIPWYGWREQILLASIIKKAKVELMHFPHWNVPLFYNEPFVVTIHDLLLLQYSTRAASTLGPIGYWFKNLAYRIVLRHAVQSAEHIIAVSEFTKQEIIKHFPQTTNKIFIIYQAPSFESPANVSASQNTIEKFGINKSYALYVGVSYPHKNLAGLVRAWKLLVERHGNDYQLVIASKKNYFSNKIEKIVQEEKISHIIFTGFVPDEDLPALYKNAALFVFPSLYEGFGLPPLEAWIFNVPVVASNRGSIPEILGMGALYFDPESIKQMADVIFQGLINDEIRYELRLAARQESLRYSWSKLAAETRAIYEKIFHKR
ncbi:MAG: hypothetical protein A2821_04395 [Candidatus Magasanikbacteria bacterium RIFCSPHIGHO2_01_FULL_41_23]|uniref:Glycosyl transferase family 1 n=1 Tax=Candidatus Magasanikbacteria bacterium RIFCSPLOWO2_01_FULL_40_15 TaxID=1798686 RepID=A0A1F6N4A0_9BACT|nr:MAG: hypothetical protein A2821_04395 [Candidatus Magasanikbacteria bacterium RIFCSPHIGHO2_01_FULL_41_23]OGH67165.1 MAG: hypothetical protein A3C66_02710 [Candidatus Magasanikbacteria bacterium RIFCSPHIGHO2_02_FULL_41_35]OGH75470.1 MAG: hypothetical protein A3F22_01435 [Candidatus Magasanikbacteria bacterium RIFCSPHIGHO2_12_FULL_41_16]OGH78702.1 MAG: hypothetical protein A2983_04350 [Candidatus Magasanikbacteria bacterium RIFCSPLOWO2_01_FULL_40_15]